MKQVVVREFGGPEVLSIVDVPVPVLSPGEILVRIHSAIVCFPDVLFRSGRYPLKEGVLPYIPCSEATGTVEALAPDVKGIEVGQNVFLNVLMTSPVELMGYARELAAVPAASVITIPGNIDLGDAIGVGYYALAHSLLYRGNHALPKTLLQSGAAGSFASSLVQLASLLGVTVIGTVSGDEKAEFARKSGAAHTINYQTENVVERVLELTDGRGVDLIVDHIGGADFPKLLDALAPFGEICVVNMEKGSAQTDLLAPFVTHSKRWPAVRYFAGHGFDKDMDTLKAHANEIVTLMAERGLRPVIARSFTMDKIAEAHRLVETAAPMGRVVVAVDAK